MLKKGQNTQITKKIFSNRTLVAWSQICQHISTDHIMLVAVEASNKITLNKLNSYIFNFETFSGSSWLIFNNFE